jgi:hypothetical protein
MSTVHDRFMAFEEHFLQCGHCGSVSFEGRNAFTLCLTGRLLRDSYDSSAATRNKVEGRDKMKCP